MITAGLLMAGAISEKPGASELAGPRNLQVAAFNAIPAAKEPARTRFEIALERDVLFQLRTLPSPNRVIVDLPEVGMRLPSTVEEHATGIVKSFRRGLSAPGRSSIVIEVREPVVVEQAVIVKDGAAPRLVLDLVPASSSTAGESAQGKRPPKTQGSELGAAVQPPLPSPAEHPEERAKRIYKPVIVIDPGHGGDDSGAVKNGIVEKDAVLAFSKVLRSKLLSTGRYRVVMTRDSDVFIPLDERRVIAERHKAGLFIAVHADYAGSNARGATIYSLTDTTANALQRSARAEVAETVLTGKELSAVQKAAADTDVIKGMLADLAQREVDVTKERTSKLARSVIDFMRASTSMRENADREANFRVLKTAKMPAVLIELAYVTNAQDAQNLRSEKWREKVAESIATAIESYLSTPDAKIPM